MTGGLCKEGSVGGEARRGGRCLGVGGLWVLHTYILE